MIIYLIARKRDGKGYVGQSCGTLKARLAQHIREDITGIGASIRREGRGKFTAEVIAEPTCDEEANMLERLYITKLGTMEPNGYNRKPGGDGRRPHGRRLSKKFHPRPKLELPEYYIDEPATDLLEKARQDFADSMSVI